MYCSIDDCKEQMGICSTLFRSIETCDSIDLAWNNNCLSIQESLLQAFAVCRRRQAIEFLEGVLEIIGVGEAAAKGDGGDGIIGGCKFQGCFLQADVDQVLPYA